MRDTHDLWHAVTGYRGDVLGETALLAFSLAQTWNLGIATVLVVGLLKTMNEPETRSLVLDGFRRGLRAVWLAAVDWEALLAQPVQEVRALLNIDTLPVYTPLRVDDKKSPVSMRMGAPELNVGLSGGSSAAQHRRPTPGDGRRPAQL